MREIKITPAISTLLFAIRKHEAPKGFGQVYSGIPARLQVDVSKMTVADVLAWQKRIRDRKLAASTAAGGYQFIYMTLSACVREMGLKGTEIFDEALQNRMAVYLMQKRGLGEYLDGTISAEDFANNLAKEWASLPVVTAIQGQKRKLKPGQSYYAGDGLNKAFHAPDTVMALVRAIRTPEKPAQPVSVPEPPKVAQEEVKPPVASPAPVKVSWLGKLFGWGAS